MGYLGHFLGREVRFYLVLTDFFWITDFEKIPRALMTKDLMENVLGCPLRLLPTAGVCDQHLVTFSRLQPTVGVCD